MTFRPEQLPPLRQLAARVLATDNFNSRRLRAVGLAQAEDLENAWSRVPFTTKAELQADALANSPWGSLLTEPLERYTRFCQTSGTSTGSPMAWLDTPESWAVMLRCWQRVFEAAGLEPGTARIYFAFSFGPFLGFWTAFEAAADQYLALPGGGLSSEARLEAILRYGATCVCCTPTYALRLGELAQHHSHQVRTLIVAGEPGGSVPAVRQRLEALWGAQVLDHHGMTEVGPVTFQRVGRPGILEVMEDAYLAEVIDPVSLEPVPDGAEGELVLTTLLRTSAPLIRYRTGDWVRARRVGEALCLEGGILSRCDEMLVIRGVNVYPSAVDNVVRAFDEVAEYQVLHSRVNAMDELEIQIEPLPGAEVMLAEQIEKKLRDTFSLRMDVTLVPMGSLPRQEFKAQRWVQKQGA